MAKAPQHVRSVVDSALEDNDGIVRLKPAWVARDFLAPGRRLGLDEECYSLGERGGICERWLASTTLADNKVRVPNEGLSFLALDSGERITLKEAVQEAGPAIMGSDYAATHHGLGRLAKIFDYADRLPYHLHQMEEHARLVGSKSKEEAYYFPEGVPMGAAPEIFFGVHPYIAREKRYEMLLPHLEEWKDDGILQHARGFRQLPGDGFHVPAGTLHAPGTALTIELQEDSDVFAMLQARVGDRTIPKELLFKDVRPEDHRRLGERIILDMIDWEVNGDPYFYENRHIPPVYVDGSGQPGGEEYWIFYNTNLFSGKKMVTRPSRKFVSRDKGVCSLFVWRGKGRFGGLDIEAGNPELDELLVSHDRAVQPLEVENTGSTDLIIFKFFGPDINTDVPFLPKYA